MEYLKKEVESIKTGMLNTSRLVQWSEYMDYIINLVLLLIYERMQMLELSTGESGVIEYLGTIYIV